MRNSSGLDTKDIPLHSSRIHRSGLTSVGTLVILFVGLSMLLVSGCKRSKKRPTVPKDVQATANTNPAEAGEAQKPEEPEATPEEVPGITPDTAIELVRNKRVEIEVPANKDEGHRWFRLPQMSEPGSLVLSLAGKPYVKWKMVIHRDEPDPAGPPVVLPISQEQFGQGIKVTGIAAGPDMPQWVVHVTPRRIRKGTETMTIRVHVEGAPRRDGEEHEPTNGETSTADPLDLVAGAEGMLSFPSDRDCISLPERNVKEDNCMGATFEIIGTTRHPISIRSYDGRGRRSEPIDLGAQTGRSLIAIPGYTARGFCVSNGPISNEAVPWKVKPAPGGCTAPADGADSGDSDVPKIMAPEPPPRPILARYGQDQSFTRTIEPARGQDRVVIQATEMPVMVSVEGPVITSWENRRMTMPIMKPGRRGMLIVRPASTTDQAVEYRLRLNSLKAAPVREPGAEPIRAGGRGVYTAIPPKKSVTVLTPRNKMERALWEVQHLGVPGDPAIVVKATDGLKREVTERTVEAGDIAVLTLPLGYGPYAVEFKAQSENNKYIGVELLPSRKQPAGPKKEEPAPAPAPAPAPEATDKPATDAPAEPAAAASKEACCAQCAAGANTDPTGADISAKACSAYAGQSVNGKAVMTDDCAKWFGANPMNVSDCR
ncbi:MAG: hypothetical protein CMH54_14740 [Myxococcales bacterium]|nr:hypothetical protein [Myxococcales bacterium]